MTGIAFQMGATIFLCAYVGKKLDAYYELEKQWFTMGFVIFGVAASLYLVLKQLDRINRSNK
nr:AtpZ/AtpI family protein [Aquimarina sp. MMG016]